MMPQQAIIADDYQAFAQQELERYIEAQAEEIAPEVNFSFQALPIATETILRHARSLAVEKQKRSRTEYKKLLSEHGWLLEDKKYLKVAAAFGSFSPQDLAQIEPDTIFLLAKNSKKYQPVIDQLQDLSLRTQQVVRELIKQQRKPREPKSEKPSIWRRTKNGGRYCQIPPIHEQDERTGVTLQQMMDCEGLTAQQIVAEAISLRQAYKTGQLVLVDDASFLEYQLQSPTCEMNSNQIDEVGTDNIELSENTNCAVVEQFVSKPTNSDNFGQVQVQEHPTAENTEVPLLNDVPTEQYDQDQWHSLATRLQLLLALPIPYNRKDARTADDLVAVVTGRLSKEHYAWFDNLPKLLAQAASINPEELEWVDSVLRAKALAVIGFEVNSIVEVISARHNYQLCTGTVVNLSGPANTPIEVRLGGKRKYFHHSELRLISSTGDSSPRSDNLELNPTPTEELALKVRVGDKVNWANCPAHLINWQPFLITSIEDDQAMLDIYTHPVPLAQLQLCSTQN